MDVTILKKLGLSDKEIKVYLKLLEYGANSVRSLVDLTGLNRGTVYDVLKRLQEMGLVSYYHQETKQKFVAEPADRLSILLLQKEEELKRAKNEINELIPQLKSMRDKSDLKPATKLYEGKRGVRIILEDVLSCLEELDKKEYYVYSAKNSSEDLKKAYPDFTKARIKKKIKVKAISLAQGGKTSGLDERRWLGTDDKSGTFIIIYADKCAFISRDSQGVPVGVIIENKMIYETQKKVFLQLWNFLK